MSKAIDKLSKDLANGVSRRKAMWNFVTGLGAVGAASLFSAKKAKGAAVTSLLCQIFCNTQGKELLTICRSVYGNNVARETICNLIETEFLAGCVAFSAHCRSGFCAEFVGVSDERGVTPATFQAFQEGEGGWICVPGTTLI